MATLKSLVDETTSIKDELKNCHSNLSTALSLKGVEVSSEDKMSSLIDKVSSGMPSFPTYKAGDTYKYGPEVGTYDFESGKATWLNLIANSKIGFFAIFKGGIRFKLISSANACTYYLRHKRGDETIKSWSFPSSVTNKTIDIPDIQPLDEIYLDFPNKGSIQNCKIYFSYDI